MIAKVFVCFVLSILSVVAVRLIHCMIEPELIKNFSNVFVCVLIMNLMAN